MRRHVVVFAFAILTLLLTPVAAVVAQTYPPGLAGGHYGDGSEDHPFLVNMPVVVELVELEIDAPWSIPEIDAGEHCITGTITADPDVLELRLREQWTCSGHFRGFVHRSMSRPIVFRWDPELAAYAIVEESSGTRRHLSVVTVGDTEVLWRQLELEYTGGCCPWWEIDEAAGRIVYRLDVGGELPEPQPPDLSDVIRPRGRRK